MLRTVIASIFAMLIATHAAASDIRRVVTGLDANNKSTTMFDDHLPLVDVSSDLSLAYLWVIDTYPVGLSLKADTREKVVSVSPPENGTQFGVVDFAPFDPANGRSEYVILQTL